MKTTFDVNADCKQNGLRKFSLRAKMFQSPEEANFNEAMEEFYNDLLDILYKVNA